MFLNTSLSQIVFHDTLEKIDFVVLRKNIINGHVFKQGMY